MLEFPISKNSLPLAYLSIIYLKKRQFDSMIKVCLVAVETTKTRLRLIIDAIESILPSAIQSINRAGNVDANKLDNVLSIYSFLSADGCSNRVMFCPKLID